MARRGRYRHGNNHEGRGVYRAIDKRTNKPGYVDYISGGRPWPGNGGWKDERGRFVPKRRW